MKSAAVHLSGGSDQTFERLMAAGERVARWLGFEDGPGLASAIKADFGSLARSIHGSVPLGLVAASGSLAFPLFLRMVASRFHGVAVTYQSGGWTAEVDAGTYRNHATFYGSSYSPEAALCAAVCAYLDAVEADGAGGEP